MMAITLAEAIVEHMQEWAICCNFDQPWYVGIRSSPEPQCWENEELEFPTRGLAYVDAADTDEARRAMRKLLILGFRPVDHVCTGEQVYVFAEWYL